MTDAASCVDAPLKVSDAILIQRVVSHVLTLQVAGALPWLAWHTRLTAADRRALHARWPLRCALWLDMDDRCAPGPVGVAAAPLLPPLHRMLMAHRSTSAPAITVLANVLASACFGSHHLWQDLGATHRDDVSLLMRLAFPTLHDSNRNNLRWKRHLFLVLGDELGHEDLRPPKCEHCEGYAACFGGPAARDPAAGSSHTAAAPAAASAADQPLKSPGRTSPGPRSTPWS